MPEDIGSIRAHLNEGIAKSTEEAEWLAAATNNIGQTGQSAGVAQADMELAVSAQRQLRAGLEIIQEQTGDIQGALEALAVQAGGIALRFRDTNGFASQAHRQLTATQAEVEQASDSASDLQANTNNAATAAADAADSYQLGTGEQPPTPMARAHQLEMETAAAQHIAPIAHGLALAKLDIARHISASEQSAAKQRLLETEARNLADRLAALHADVGEFMLRLHDAHLGASELERALAEPTAELNSLPEYISTAARLLGTLAEHAQSTITEATAIRNRL